MHQGPVALRNNRYRLLSRLTAALVLVLVFWVTSATAKEYFFSWSANPEPVEGYRLYYKKGGEPAPPFTGSEAIEGTSPVDLGKQTSFALSGLEDNTTYHFALTAYNGSEESGYSEVITVFPPEQSAPPPTAGSKALTFIWQPAAGAVGGYRIYMNDILLCATADAAATSLTCNADLLRQVMSFSLAALDSSGVESERSNILVLDPANYPDLFPAHAVNYAWEFDPAIPVAGFTLYHNDIPICSTTDPLARQLSCETDLALSNSFRLVALVDGADSGSSNSLWYHYAATTEPDPQSGPLSAVITSAQQEGEAPLTLALSASDSTGPIASYLWSFGDGEQASGSSVSYTYHTAGSYELALTVADAAGLSDTATMPITVVAAITPPPELQDPTAVVSSSAAVGAAPLTVAFDGSGSSSAQPPIVDYAWDFGDGAVASGSTVSHTFNSAGTFSTTLTVTDSAGLTGKISTPVLVTEPEAALNQPPVAEFTVSSFAGAAPFTVSFDGSGSSDADGSISAYQWSFGDGGSATGSTSQHTFLLPGDYTVTLQVSDNLGLTSSAGKVINVLEEGAVGFFFELDELMVDHSWQRYDFSQEYADPVVIAGPAGSNDPEPAVVRVRNVSSSGFEIRLENWNSAVAAHAKEKVNFLVTERGSYTLADGTRIEAGRFNGKSSYGTVNFAEPFLEVPVLLSQVQSVNDANPVTPRLKSIGPSSFAAKLQQKESTKNAHGTEQVGYLAWQLGTGEFSGGEILFEAGRTANAVTDQWAEIAYTATFPALPLFLAGMQTANGDDTATVRLQSATTSAVTVFIEEEQSQDQETTHGSAETVGYLLIGSTTAGDTASEPVADVKSFTFTWEYPDSSELSGFRFYRNNELLCATDDASLRQITCQGQIKNEPQQFTMTALFTDGTESNPGNLLQIDPADHPEAFGIGQATFTWEFDQSQESSISGFRIYNHSELLCETATPQSRSAVCEVMVNSRSNLFTVRAVAGGAETNPSNAFDYQPKP